MTIWQETTEQHYDEMLGVLPPAVMTGGGFLVGEPWNHRECSIKRRIAPTFAAFMYVNGRFYVAADPMTVAEFRAVNPSDVCRAAEG